MHEKAAEYSWEHANYYLMLMLQMLLILGFIFQAELRALQDSAGQKASAPQNTASIHQ